MRQAVIIGTAILVLTGCAPVLHRGLMDRGAREFQLSHLVETPEVFKDHLFILGGVIVETKLTEMGSQIEVLFIPGLRSSQGYLAVPGEVPAVYSRSKGILDPLVFKKGAGDNAGRGLHGSAERKDRGDGVRLPGVRGPADLSPCEEYQNYPLCVAVLSLLLPYYSPNYHRSPLMYDPWGRYYPGPYWPPYPW